MQPQIARSGMQSSSLLKVTINDLSPESNPDSLKRLLKLIYWVLSSLRDEFRKGSIVRPPKPDLYDLQLRGSSYETLSKALKSAESILHTIMKFQRPDSVRQVEQIVAKVIPWWKVTSPFLDVA
jgi:hypothetical protein